MPYRSAAQQRWAHTAAGTKALGGAAKVAEWDAATDFKHLPARAGGNVKGLKGYIQRVAAKRAKGHRGAAQEAKAMSKTKRMKFRRGGGK